MTGSEIFLLGTVFGMIVGWVYFWTMLKINGKEIVNGRDSKENTGG